MSENNNSIYIQKLAENFIFIYRNSKIFKYYIFPKLTFHEKNNISTLEKEITFYNNNKNNNENENNIKNNTKWFDFARKNRLFLWKENHKNNNNNNKNNIFNLHENFIIVFLKSIERIIDENKNNKNICKILPILETAIAKAANDKKKESYEKEKYLTKNIKNNENNNKILFISGLSYDPIVIFIVWLCKSFFIPYEAEIFYNFEKNEKNNNNIPFLVMIGEIYYNTINSKNNNNNNLNILEFSEDANNSILLLFQHFLPHLQSLFFKNNKNNNYLSISSDHIFPQNKNNNNHLKIEFSELENLINITNFIRNPILENLSDNKIQNWKNIFQNLKIFEERKLRSVYFEKNKNNNNNNFLEQCYVSTCIYVLALHIPKNEIKNEKIENNNNNNNFYFPFVHKNINSITEIIIQTQKEALKNLKNSINSNKSFKIIENNVNQPIKKEENDIYCTCLSFINEIDENIKKLLISSNYNFHYLNDYFSYCWFNSQTQMNNFPFFYFLNKNYHYNQNLMGKVFENIISEKEEFFRLKQYLKNENNNKNKNNILKKFYDQYNLQKFKSYLFSNNNNNISVEHTSKL